MNLDAYAPLHPDENYPQDLVDAEIEAISDKSRPRTASTFATLARTAKECADMVDERVQEAAVEAVHA